MLCCISQIELEIRQTPAVDRPEGTVHMYSFQRHRSMARSGGCLEYCAGRLQAPGTPSGQNPMSTTHTFASPDTLICESKAWVTSRESGKGSTYAPILSNPTRVPLSSRLATCMLLDPPTKFACDYVACVFIYSNTSIESLENCLSTSSSPSASIR